MYWFQIGLLGVASLAMAQTAEDRGLALNQRALEAARQRDYSTAKVLYAEEIQLWKDLGPGFRAHLATAKYNLGETLVEEGNREPALVEMREALDINRSVLGIQNIRTIRVLTMVSNLYVMSGNRDAAEKLLLEVLPIERKFYPDSSELAQTLGALSAIRIRQDRQQEALELGDEALSLAARATGEYSPETAMLCADVAEIHRVAHRPERALPLYRRAEAIYERLVGPQHPRYASILSQEGLVLIDEGKLVLAEKNMLRASEILSGKCPLCLFERSVMDSNLAMLRLAQGKYAEADRLLTAVLKIQEQFATTPVPEMAMTLQSLAVVREKQRRNAEAADLKHRAAVILAYH